MKLHILVYGNDLTVPDGEALGVIHAECFTVLSEAVRAMLTVYKYTDILQCDLWSGTIDEMFYIEHSDDKTAMLEVMKDARSDLGFTRPFFYVSSSLQLELLTYAAAL